MSGNYNVGKGKPPEEHKWKPGQSGNPAGSSRKARERARKARELKEPKPFSEMLLDELCGMIAPNLEGKQQKMLTARGLAKALTLDGLTGKPVDRRQYIMLLEKLGVFDLLKEKSLEEDPDELPLNPAELLLLEAIAKERFADTLLDEGEGWRAGLYDLEVYETESGKTECRIIPGPAYKAKMANEDQSSGGRDEDEPIGRSQEPDINPFTGQPLSSPGEPGSTKAKGTAKGLYNDDWDHDPFPPGVKLDGEGDPEFDDPGDLDDNEGASEENNPAALIEPETGSKRPNETFVKYSGDKFTDPPPANPPP